MAHKNDSTFEAEGEPDASSTPLNEEERKDPLELRTEFYDRRKKQFQDFLNAVPADIRSLPFAELVDAVLKDAGNGNKDTTEERSTESVFKEPKVPRGTKRGRGTCNSRSVHWDQTLKNNSSSQDEAQVKLHNNSNDPSFKTPQKNFNDAFAFVTPGPKMNKRVGVLRVPKEGETAVSLSGSPLLVAPFAPNKDNQGTLIMTSDNGNTLAILQPPTGSHYHDSHLKNLQDDTKKKIQDFASYLLKSLEEKEKTN